MMLQIPRLLNKTLSSDPTKLKFIVPPIAIPIDGQGIVVKSKEAASTHYGAPVFEERNGKLYFLEFDKFLFAGLMGYIRRHKKIENLEIIFFRNNEGQIRMTIGSEHPMNPNALDDLRGKMQIISAKVEQFYSTSLGYKVHDMTGEVNA